MTTVFFRIPFAFFKLIFLFVVTFLATFLFCSSLLTAQPNWNAIKNNATFVVADSSYDVPFIQPINVGGWEDGLFMTRDGLNLFSTYLPLDAFSWIVDLLANPLCFDFNPYYRPPLLGIDTVTNSLGCPNFMHSDIVRSVRADTSLAFQPWQPSNLQLEFSFEGGAHGILKQNADSFDLFVFTRDGIGTQSVDIMFMKDVPLNPDQSAAVPVLSTPAMEDNPHIERIDTLNIILMFDRDRYIYYSISNNNGISWQTPNLVSNVLNDQAPYDVQPHLWNDGVDWWVYFCANSTSSVRGIYKSKQMVPGDWGSWGPKELVIEGGPVTGGSGTIFGVGEPTLTHWGDLSFVVVYGDINSADTTDVFDCDPWFLPRKNSPLSLFYQETLPLFSVYPNPSSDFITISLRNPGSTETFRLIDSKGKIVSVFAASNNEQISIKQLAPGVYTLMCLNCISKPVRIVR